VTEYVNGELREKVVSIICEWAQQVEEGAETDQYLESATISEQLVNESTEVTDEALIQVLVQLARDGEITLTIGRGITTVYDINADLCP
jgi:hypothetical protein